MLDTPQAFNQMMFPYGRYFKQPNTAPSDGTGLAPNVAKLLSSDPAAAAQAIKAANASRYASADAVYNTALAAAQKQGYANDEADGDGFQYPPGMPADVDKRAIFKSAMLGDGRYPAASATPAATGLKPSVAAAINPRWNPSTAQIAQDGALAPQPAAAASPGMPTGVRQVNLPYDAGSMSVGLDEHGNPMTIAPAPIYATTDKNGNPVFSNVGAADAAFLRDGINSGARTGMGRRGMGGTFYDGNAPSDSDMAANASLDALNAAHGGGTVRPLNYFGRSYTSELPAGGQQGMPYNDAKAWEDKNGGAAADESAVRAAQVMRNRMAEFAFQKKLQMLPQNYADAVKGQAAQMQGQAGLNSSFARLMEAQNATDPAAIAFRDAYAKSGDAGAASQLAASISPNSPFAGPANTSAEQYLAGETQGLLSLFGFKPQSSPETIADPNTIVNIGPSLVHGGQAVTFTRPGKDGKPQSYTYSLDNMPSDVRQNVMRYVAQRSLMQRALAGGMGRR